MRHCTLALLGSTLIAAAAAPAGAGVCGSFGTPPQLSPVMPSAQFGNDDAAVDCYMWQLFIYLNWPGSSQNRGQPDKGAAFGAARPTVWEGYKNFNEIYLPGGKAPAAWNDRRQALRGLRLRGQARPTPALRQLHHTGKLFRKLGEHEASNLSDIAQFDGATLYDQVSQPVYYEMLTNQQAFDYIVGNRLYDADKQVAFAENTGIALPFGSVEVKAAWKVLTPAEASARPLRFHTAQALLPGSNQPATVGLVGLHVFHMPSANFRQGFWATFQQVDNAPVLNGAAQASYSFNNPNCAPSRCPVNEQGTKPTQLKQMMPVPLLAQNVNNYVAALVGKQAPQAPWQYYQLLSVQWPTSAQGLSKAQPTPLPLGSPNTTTLVNPVLESFAQKNNKSCLGCHMFATVSQHSLRQQINYGASYSFMFGHAQQALPPGARTKP